MPLDEVYVTANVKEIQVSGLHDNEPVNCVVDTFEDHELEEVIDSLASGTSVEFSVLPRENATGNFAKIVQRLPVRIQAVMLAMAVSRKPHPWQVTIALSMMIDIDHLVWSPFKRIDFVGIALVAARFQSLEFVLYEGPRDDWFASDLTLTFLSGVSALLLYFR